MSKPEVNAENYRKFRVIADEINKKLSQISHDTGGYSTHVHTIRHKDFVSLVDMGEKIVPYVFYLGTEKGWSWTLLLLLNEIAPHPPVIAPDDRGRFMNLIHTWLGWYIGQERYKNIGVYLGLVD
jgi:hypothetical protein